MQSTPRLGKECGPLTFATVHEVIAATMVAIEDIRKPASGDPRSRGDIMPKIAILFGGLLTALGLWAYFGSGSESPSPTALIPAGFGVLLAGCGVLGLVEAWRKHAMHVAAAVGLLGVLGGCGRGLSKVGVLVSGDGNSRAVLISLTLGLLCLVYVALSVRSFILARRRQRAAAGV